VAGIRASATNSLLVDSGYLFTGSLFWYLYNSTILARYYDALDYDAVKIDVYEFAPGVSVLAYFVGHLNGTRVVAANLLHQHEDPRLANTTLYAYAIVQYPGGERVGFASTLVGDIAPLFGNSYPLNSSQELQGMLKAVGALQNQGVNKIIAAVSGSSALDSVVDYVPGIDVVIVGDTFYANPVNGTRLNYDKPTGAYPQVRHMPWEQPLLVVGCGRFGKNVGVLNLTFDDAGVITAYEGNAVQLSDAIAGDPVVHQRIAQDYANVQDSLGIVVGRAAHDIGYEHSCLFGECAMGDWAGQVFRAFGRTQIGMLGGGAIYGGFGAGDITLGQQLTDFPFVGQNQLWTFALRGRHLLLALEQAVSLAEKTWLPVSEGVGRFMQVAGVNFTWNARETVGARVADAWVETAPSRWELLDADQLYNITTVDYNAKGGNGFTMFVDDSIGVVNTGVFALEVLLAALNRSLGPDAAINAKVDGRIAPTNATRRSCFTPPGGSGATLCNGNGYCLGGVCHCTREGAGGPLCAMAADAGSGQNGGGSGGVDTSAIVGAVVGASVGVLVLVLLAVVVAATFIARSRKQDEEDWTIAYEEIRIGEMLGRGGFGTVYRAHWRNTEVAVKTLASDSLSRQMRDDFKAEAKTMARLRCTQLPPHPPLFRCSARALAGASANGAVALSFFLSLS
jgi:5'-nucleotidase